MGRYTGPVEKLSRREGVQLYVKGERVAPEIPVPITEQLIVELYSK